MHYDFIEIGTSDFETLIDTASHDTVGLSIEPIKYYLDKLPNKDNVKKLNYAVLPTDTSEEMHIHYVPEDKIENKDFWWIKGCCQVGKNHPALEGWGDNIVREKINTISVADLIVKYNITSVAHLKIDTEGSDCGILNAWLDYCVATDQNSVLPKTIKFEANTLTTKKALTYTLSKFAKFYNIISRTPDDIVLQRTYNKGETSLMSISLKTYNPADYHIDLKKYSEMSYFKNALWLDIPESAFNNFGASVFVSTNGISNRDQTLKNRLELAMKNNEKIVIAARHEGAFWFYHNNYLRHVLNKDASYIKNNILLLLAGLNPTTDIKTLCNWEGDTIIAPWVIYDDATTHFNILFKKPNSTKKTKSFLLFNRRNKIHRTRLVAYLHEYNVLNDCHYSFFGDATIVPNKGDMLVDNYFTNNLLPQFKQCDDYELIKNNINSIGINKELDREFFTQSGKGIYIRENTHTLYEESMFSLVTETWTHDKESKDVSISEKTFKPIFMSQPFIILGQHNHLKMVKQLGFKTFDKWIDESYDNIKDPIERTIAIAKLAKDINDWSDTEKLKFLDEVEEVCLHNYELLRHNKEGILSSCSVSYGMDKQPDTHLVCFGEGHYDQIGTNFVTDTKNNEELPYTTITRYNDTDIHTYMQQYWKDIDYKTIRGYGYWIWKPFIILEKLKELQDGDILHYCDVDLYNRISDRNWPCLIDEVHQYNVVANMLHNFPERHWNKQYTINKLNMNQDYLSTGQVESGDISILITPQTRKLIQDWQNLMLHEFPKMIDDNSYGVTEHLEFKEHRHDQSIFSFLYKAFRQCVPIYTTTEHGMIDSRPGDVK